MTKTLTEQWRDNDLADDKLYYWIISDGQELVQNKLGMCAYRLCKDADKIECLAPVPSYDELQKLKKKLAIATKALKEYANSDEWELVDSKNVYWSRKRLPYPWRIAGKALKEIEEIEE